MTRSLSENRQPYCEQSEFGHFLSCFSLNKTTIRLKTPQKLAQMSLLSLRALFSDRLLEALYGVYINLMEAVIVFIAGVLAMAKRFVTFVTIAPLCQFVVAAVFIGVHQYPPALSLL